MYRFNFQAYLNKQNYREFKYNKCIGSILYTVISLVLFHYLNTTNVSVQLRVAISASSPLTYLNTTNVSVQFRYGAYKRRDEFI